MARTAARPNRPRTEAPAPPPAAARVPARRTTHWRDAALLVALGLVGYGWATWDGHPDRAMALLVGLPILGLVSGVLGERRRQRMLTEDRVLEALIAEPGLRFARLDRRSVRLTRWTRWRPGDGSREMGAKRWLGLPRRIRIRFAPAARDADMDWSSLVVSIIANRLQARYEIARLDHIACVMWVDLDTTDDAETVEPHPAQVRAVRALSKLIDPSVHLIDAEVSGDELQSITVSHEAAEKMAGAGAQTRVERIISTMHPGRWRARWDTVNDTVRFEQRPNLPGSVWLPTAMPENVDDLLANYEKVRIPYGIDEDGEEISWAPAVVPQMLIIGGTGSGKTATTHAIVGEVTKYGWPVWVLDGKRVEFLKHRTWPNVQVVATTVAQQVAFIHQVWLLQQERYRLMEEEGLTPSDFEPLVVILDEWAEFVSELYDWYGSIKQKGDPTKPPTLREHASLVRKARTARIHLIQTMQRPDVALFGGGAGGEVRSNFGQRISVGRLDPQGAMMMWANPATGTTIPRGVRQRSITTNADGVPVEVQCYRFPSMTAADDTDEGRLREQLRPAVTRWPRLLILPPEQKDSLDDDGKETIGFWDWAETDWVRADARPDLDPVVQSERRRSAGDARIAASTMAVLGLHENELTRELDPRTPGQRPRIRPTEVEETDGGYVDEYDVPLDLDDYSGYGPEVRMLPSEVQIGDLIQVEDAAGAWAVVDELPEEDVLDPTLTVISWRDDADQSGAVSLPTDTRIAVRRPEESA